MDNLRLGRPNAKFMQTLARRERERQEKRYQELVKTPLTFDFTGLGNDYLFQITLQTSSSKLVTSLDNGQTWQDFTGGHLDPQEPYNTILMRAADGYMNYGQIVSNIITNAKIYGNALSLCVPTFANGDLPDNFIDWVNADCQGTYKPAFYSMFGRQCLTTDFSEMVLPSKKLAKRLYFGMFRGNSNIKIAPRLLPATTCPNFCYRNMFQACTSLEVGPHIMATEFPFDAIDQKCLAMTVMFAGCTSLKTVEVDFTTWDRDRTSDWLLGTSENGTLIGPAELGLPSNREDSTLPSGWSFQAK